MLTLSEDDLRTVLQHVAHGTLRPEAALRELTRASESGRAPCVPAIAAPDIEGLLLQALLERAGVLPSPRELLAAVMQRSKGQANPAEVEKVIARVFGDRTDPPSPDPSPEVLDAIVLAVLGTANTIDPLPVTWVIAQTQRQVAPTVSSALAVRAAVRRAVDRKLFTPTASVTEALGD